MNRVKARRRLWLALLLVLGQCTLALHASQDLTPGPSQCVVCAAHSAQIAEAHPPVLAPVPTNRVVYRIPAMPAPAEADTPRPAFRSRAPPHLFV